MLKLSILLGVLAALADVAGGLVLVRAKGVERYLRYFVALGAGFLMATALLEMTPESLSLSPRLGPILIVGGFSVHALFDGVAIGSGFVVNNALGWLIFLAIFLHKAPEGFTMASVMLASGRSRTVAFYSAVALAAATLAGVLVIELAPHWMPYGLPISAGVALYVGASDLVPEVNREPGIRMALVFFLGVAAFLILRTLLPAL